jgi:hypothetical protein
VIGSTTLGLWSDATLSTSGLTVYSCIMPFMVKDVPAERRYGFQMSGVPA